MNYTQPDETIDRILSSRKAGHPGVAEAAKTDRLAQSRLSRADIVGHKGSVLWFTGLSGAGKSTLAVKLEATLLRRRMLAIVIDGDLLRTGLSRDLGFSADDRRENLRRAGELAMHLADGGLIVIAALISPIRADREAVAQRLNTQGIPFAEVFVNAPLHICERRDPKGLYRKARRGEIPSFTGIDSPYEAPLNPDFEIKTDVESVDRSVDRLAELVAKLSRPPDKTLAEGV